jgi:hypothetical protein
MLPWLEFVKKYALQQNILYDTALVLPECLDAYQRYKAEQLERHRARVRGLASQVQRNVEEAKRERHRARVLAMNTKVDELVKEERVIQNQRVLISELSEKISFKGEADANQITCMTTAEPPPPPPRPSRPSPPPRPMTPTPMRNPTGYYGRGRSCGRQRMNMFFTMK